VPFDLGARLNRQNDERINTVPSACVVNKTRLIEIVPADTVIDVIKCAKFCVQLRCFGITGGQTFDSPLENSAFWPGHILIQRSFIHSR
jgi:hypothetical protein